MQDLALAEDLRAGPLPLAFEGKGEDRHASPADEATAAVLRLVRGRAFFSKFLIGSGALHLCLLVLVLWLERAPPLPPVRTQEVPVDLVTDPLAKPVARPAGEAGKPKGQKDASEAAKGAPPAPAKPVPPPKPVEAKINAPKPAPSKPPAKMDIAKSQPPKPDIVKPVTAKPEPAPPKPQPAPAKLAPLRPAFKPQSPPEPPKPALPAAPKPPNPPVAPQRTVMLPSGPPPAAHMSPLAVTEDDSPAVAVPKPSADGDDVVSYQTLVFGMLELKKQFPEDARRRGAYGTALITFELNDDGTVKSEKLLKSSGDAALDVESLALVQRAAPFPKPPPGAQKIFAADITFPPPTN